MCKDDDSIGKEADAFTDGGLIAGLISMFVIYAIIGSIIYWFLT